jgi:hypothetical protein
MRMPRIRKKNKGDYELHFCTPEKKPRGGTTPPGLPAPQALRYPEEAI